MLTAKAHDISDNAMSRRSRASELPLGPFDEPSNEELGIEPLVGWRLGAVWLALMAVSVAILIVLGLGLLAILS